MSISTFPSISLPLAALAMVGCTACCCARTPSRDPARPAECPGTAARPGLWKATTEIAGFHIQRRRCNDQISVRRQGGRVVIDIHSPYGISSANIVPVTTGWPSEVIVQLHLRGLERFSALTGNAQVFQGSVSGTAPANRRVSCALGGQPCKTLAAPGARIPSISLVGSQHIPLQKGYIRVRLPKELFVRPRSPLRLSWIDFFRR